MRKTERELTASELAERLTRSQAYQAKRRAQAERAARIHAEEAALLSRLLEYGHGAGSLQDLVERNTPLPSGLAEALTDALASVSEPALQESIVRALGASGAPFDLQPLIRLFEETTSEPLRWAIANTFAELRPLGIRTWLLAALRNPVYGKAREMLALAVARTSPASDANSVLLALLEEMPGHAALALAESGTAEELRVLEARLASAKGWVKKVIERAIRTISRRLQK